MIRPSVQVNLKLLGLRVRKVPILIVSLQVVFSEKDDIAIQARKPHSILQALVMVLIVPPHVLLRGFCRIAIRASNWTYMMVDMFSIDM